VFAIGAPDAPTLTKVVPSSGWTGSGTSLSLGNKGREACTAGTVSVVVVYAAGHESDNKIVSGNSGFI
jgi:hypothetical protein